LSIPRSSIASISAKVSNGYRFAGVFDDGSGLPDGGGVVEFGVTIFRSFLFKGRITALTLRSFSAKSPIGLSASDNTQKPASQLPQAYRRGWVNSKGSRALLRFQRPAHLASNRDTSKIASLPRNFVAIICPFAFNWP